MEGAGRWLTGLAGEWLAAVRQGWPAGLAHTVAGSTGTIVAAAAATRSGPNRAPGVQAPAWLPAWPSRMRHTVSAVIAAVTSRPRPSVARAATAFPSLSCASAYAYEVPSVTGRWPGTAKNAITSPAPLAR